MDGTGRDDGGSVLREQWVSTDRRPGHRGRTYRVETLGDDGPPVVLLHEVFGPSPSTMQLAEALATGDPGFTVHVPALFGRHGAATPLGVLGSKICLRREFVLFRTGRTSPIVGWLRHLVDEVSQRHDGRPVGVVGMCLTGGFALAMVTHDRVAAAVASQPSLPMAPLRGPAARADLGLSPGDRASPSASRQKLMVLRYDQDRLCPAVRAAAAIGDTVEAARPDPLDPSVEVTQGTRGRLVEVADEPGVGALSARHAVLTVDLSPRALDLVRAWLADRLGDGAG